MSFWSRLLLALRDLFGGAGGGDDPREALDLAYRGQLELQAKVRRAVADVVTARKRIELQARQLAVSNERLEEQARAAVREGRHDLARDALTRRAVMGAEQAELDRQSSALAAEEATLLATASQVDIRVQQIRVRREAALATRAAADARARLGEALTGLAQRDAEVMAALERAQGRLTDARGRVAALDGVAARAALPGGAPGGATGEQQPEADVAAELRRLEEELLWGRGDEDRP